MPQRTVRRERGARGAESAQLFRLIAETIPHMVWTARPDGWNDYLNARVREYTGLTTPQLEGWGWSSILHPEDRERCLERWTAALRNGRPYAIEFRLRRHDGAYLWHLGAAMPLRTGGRIVRWFGTCTDIDDQKKAARLLEQARQTLESLVAARTQELEESEIRFRTLMDNAPAIAWIKDSRFRYTWVSDKHLRELGKSLEAVRGRDDFELWPEDLARRFRRLDEEALRVNGPVQSIDHLPDAAGNEAHWLVMKFPLPQQSGERGVAGIGIDITERHRLERTVRQLLNRLVQTQEAERREVAANLHDLIGQKLTVLGIGLDILRQETPREMGPDLAGRLAQMSALLGETVGAIRDVIADLRPAVLDDHGLVPALHWHASVFEARTGLRVRVAGPEHGPRFDHNIETALFRIAQEALTNCAKHSGASLVEVRFRQGAQTLELCVEDNGRGFREPREVQVVRRGWGLQAMRERAEAVGGALRIESSRSGTRIVVTVPVGDGDQRHPG